MVMHRHLKCKQTNFKKRDAYSILRWLFALEK